MRRRSNIPLCLLTAWLVAVAASCTQPPRPESSPADTVATESATVTVSRPTVVAYFIVPDGAVDTLPDLAVRADDWNYAMAMVGDSLEANGFGFALVTGPRVRLTEEGGLDTTLTLGEPLTAGYVFARPGALPCVRRRALDPDSVLAAARVAFALGATPTDWCER